MVLQTKDIGASMQDIIRVCSKNPDALEKALTLVLAAVDAGKIVNYWHAAQEQFKYMRSIGTRSTLDTM
ncbi:hypothetical protein JTE90_024819 [Oedothorax gibbosus]|uniref:Uncharacterized protein n=1 Tax=Oedothorax gibbosus TaxID=931172 RepID=A0AAV6TCW3_9ARAC|nr:hypothetical protein JTE90_024819 [Oedothorax gibbosus]